MSNGRAKARASFAGQTSGVAAPSAEVALATSTHLSLVTASNGWLLKAAVVTWPTIIDAERMNHDMWPRPSFMMVVEYVHRGLGMIERQDEGIEPKPINV